jgi:hypothetical protein
MTKNRVAVLAALLIAGASQAGGTDVKDKSAPTTFASNVGCTTAPVPPCSPCCTKCKEGHACLAKVKDWFCFIPIRTCPCECPRVCTCYPPPYLYFLRPCVEGAGCTHYCSNCSSCTSKRCASCGGCATACQRVNQPAAACNSCGTCK